MIQEEFIFIDVKFKLLGIIYLPSSNHYTSYCHSCFTNKLNLVKNKSYYYDDILNGEIIKIEDNYFKNKWIEHHIIILLLLFMAKIKIQY